MGTDMFLTLIGHDKDIEAEDPMTELSISALCSNRHLPEHLPVGETGADFLFLDNDQIKIPGHRATDPSARAADQRYIGSHAPQLYRRKRLAVGQHAVAEPSGPGAEPGR